MLPKSLQDIVDRFKRVESVGQRMLRIEQQEKEDAEERDRLARLDRLGAWASDATAEEEFVPFLKGRIELLESERVKILSDHPRLCEYLGREAELKWLLAQFREWADKA